MAWDGVEKRKEQRYCDGHLEFSNTLVRIEERQIAIDRRINGSIDAVEKHIEHGTKWRLAIVVAFIGLVGVFLGSIKGLGKAEKQIEVNTGRLDRLESPKFK